jgi:serine/threonine protein kinase
MEYVPEGSLENMLHDENFIINEELYISIGLDIAKGMYHIHSENMIHCDLSARNLLLYKYQNNTYTIKVADFGLAHSILDSEIYVAKDTKIPLAWSPPEVILSKKFSKKSDIWSFGATMWEISQRKKPFSDKTNNEIKKLICEEKRYLSKPDKMSEELWSFFKKCFEYEPEKRPFFSDILKFLENFRENMFHSTNSGSYITE